MTAVKTSVKSMSSAVLWHVLVGRFITIDVVPLLASVATSVTSWTASRVGVTELRANRSYAVLHTQNNSHLQGNCDM